jgi:hypothetical protein
VDPTVGLLWAFHVHADDEDVLRAQIDQKHVDELDPAIGADALDRGLDNNVDLMRCALDLQNLVFDTCNNSGHDNNVPVCHGVLDVGQHVD